MLSSAYEYLLFARCVASYRCFYWMTKPIKSMWSISMSSTTSWSQLKFSHMRWLAVSMLWATRNSFAKICCAPQVQNIKAPFPMIWRNAVDCDVASKLWRLFSNQGGQGSSGACQCEGLPWQGVGRGDTTLSKMQLTQNPATKFLRTLNLIMAQFRVGNHEAIQSIIMAKHTFDVGSGSLKSSFDLLSLFDLPKRQLDAKERSNLPRILFINPQSLNNPSIPQAHLNNPCWKWCCMFFECRKWYWYCQSNIG